MKRLLVHPLFTAGILLRLVLVAVVVPVPVADWYAPFLAASTEAFTLDPWGAWLREGGSPAAFPYGYAMWCFFLPFTLVGKLLGLPLAVGHGLTLVAADLALLAALRRLAPGQDSGLLALYWLSPIVLVPTYGLGHNDIVPVLFLVVALQCLRMLRPAWAGAAMVAAVSAKLSMVLAVPFLLIYLFHNRPLRQQLARFLTGAGVAVLGLGLPFLLSSAGLQMLLGNPEVGKVYRLAVQLGGNATVYVVPLVYLAMLYAAWRIRRLNFDLLQAMLGMAFLLVVLTTSASPGWYVWVLPLLVIYQLQSDRTAVALVTAFSILFAAVSLLSSPSVAQVLAGAPGLPSDPARADDLLRHGTAILHTALVASGIILGLRIWRETVSRNDYFRLSRKPFVIGVAGDSGAGKDTFAESMRRLFGGHSVAMLSGDSYHLWDRQKPIWQVMTHLNPMSNDLERFSNDLVALADGRSIVARHYDHQTGQLGHPARVDSNDFLIVSGLHALYLPLMRACYDLSVYLDMDESLRRHFKIRRDVHERGHPMERVLESIERRARDAARFIHPQATRADLVFSLQPIHPRILEDEPGRHPMRFKLVARSHHGLNAPTLIRTLVGVCGLHVDMAADDADGRVELTIEGETSPEDVALAAQMVCPRILEFLDLQPGWEGGMAGLMQLITLAHINQALTKRFI